MKFLLSVALLALSFSCLAQNEIERYVFWQPNVKLTFDMFENYFVEKDYIKLTSDDEVFPDTPKPEVYHEKFGCLSR